MTAPTFSWNDLVDEPQVHDCDCEHCDSVGLTEEPAYPQLVTFVHAGLEYVTDRVLALRADLAPVPENWHHERVMTSASPAPRGDVFGDVTDQAPTDRQFANKYLFMVGRHGWRLRYAEKADGGRCRAVTVITSTGEPIGLLMPVSDAADDPAYSRYTEDDQ